IGIIYFPPANVGADPSATMVFDHVTAINNDTGIAIDPEVVPTGTVNFSIAQSIASNNARYGIAAFPRGGAFTAVIDSTYISNNTEKGLFGGGPTVLALSRSVITSNGVGIETTAPVNSYGDNRINSNGTDIKGSLDEMNDRLR